MKQNENTKRLRYRRFYHCVYSFFELAAHADEWDLNTTMTFSELIQIPGQMLPAGTYVFRLADPDAAHNIVQIFKSDRTVVYATLQTIATARRHQTDDTAITLVKQGAGKPDALLNWFYPGREVGNEFVYSKQREKELEPKILSRLSWRTNTHFPTPRPPELATKLMAWHSLAHHPLNLTSV